LKLSDCRTYNDLVEQLREHGITEAPGHAAYNDSGLDRQQHDEVIRELTG
jgi:hypothetical protein